MHCPLGQHLKTLDGQSGMQWVTTLNGSEKADAVVDNVSATPLELRARLMALAGKAAHYVLVSTHRVYPVAPRLRPWSADELDACADQFPSLPRDVANARALERELVITAGLAGLPFTIVRPALVDIPGSSDSVTHWFVRRVVHGGVVVLPEGDLPSYRHVSIEELAGALALVAGEPRAFGARLNVANQALLGYWGHAAMVRDALRLPLRFGYVPQWRWRAAGLALPLGELGSAAFIEPSPLLAELGWQTGDVTTTVYAAARKWREAGVGTIDSVITLERRVLAEAEQDTSYVPGKSGAPLPVHDTPQWSLRGWAGRPGGLALERIERTHPMTRPLVKIRALSLGPTEEKFLKGEYPQRGHRAIGHNAILEILQKGEADLEEGSLAIPVAALGCGDATCRFCQGGANGVLGIGCDGYGWSVCPTPPQHLVPVPPRLGHAALLADPLAALMAALGPALAKDSAPVWVAGRTIEALLASWLIEDAGRTVHRVDRRAWTHSLYPVVPVEQLAGERRNNQIPAPTLAIDFTGCADVSWPLGQALAPGGELFVRNRPPGVPHGIHWHHLPAAAPNRAALEAAVALLMNWRAFRNLDAHIGPAIPLDLYWDVLLPAPFSMPFLEDRQ
jgi:nucleoside-diphosphate-sugar epimerase